MREELQYAARRVFAEFIDSFESSLGKRDWTQEFHEKDCARMGLSEAQVEGALALLVNEGLIAEDIDFELTDLGYRACVHRELIDEILGSPAMARGIALHFSAQNVIIGDGNTLQVNSDEVIAKLVAHITADSAIEPERKKRWLEVLKDVGGHVAAEGLKVLIEQSLKAGGVIK